MVPFNSEPSYIRNRFRLTRRPLICSETIISISCCRTNTLPGNWPCSLRTNQFAMDIATPLFGSWPIIDFYLLETCWSADSILFIAMSWIGEAQHVPSEIKLISRNWQIMQPRCRCWSWSDRWTERSAVILSEVCALGVLLYLSWFRVGVYCGFWPIPPTSVNGEDVGGGDKPKMSNWLIARNRIIAGHQSVF